MSSKNMGSEEQKELTNSVPLRRSLRLSSCSPTRSRVMTRSCVSESKLTKKSLSFNELSSKKEKTPVTKRNIEKKDGSASPDLKKRTIAAEKNFIENSQEEHHTTKNISASDSRKIISNKYVSLEQIAEINEENRISKRVTRSQTNYIVENVNNEKENILIANTEKNIEFKALPLKPIKEVCEDIILSKNDDEPSAVETVDTEEKLHINKTEGGQCPLEETTKCNKENMCPENELKYKNTSPVEKQDYDNPSSTKSESDSFSISSDAAVSDVENKITVNLVGGSFNGENKPNENDLCTNKSPIHLQSCINNANESKNVYVIEVNEPVDNASDNKSSQISNEVVEANNTLQPENPGKRSGCNEKEQIDKEKLDDSYSEGVFLNKSEQSHEPNSCESRSSRDSNIESKIEDLLQKHNFPSSEDEDEEHPFIETMAEEGEEDTPSEGSNDIIDLGEEINTTESEFSTDDSYDQNSFIDDEEHCVLLSGEEYDLSLNSPKKKSRIIQLSSGSDDEIVKINRVKKEKPIKRKKSRIIKFSESSEGEADLNDVKDSEIHPQEVKNFVSAVSEKNNFAHQNETGEKITTNEKDINAESEKNDKNLNANQISATETSPQKVEEIPSNKNIEQTNAPNIAEGGSERDIISVDNTTNESKEVTVSNTANSEKQQMITGTNENDDICEITFDKETSNYRPQSTPVSKIKCDIIVDDNKDVFVDTTPSKNNDSSVHDTSSAFNTGGQNFKKKMVVIENIRVQDIKNKRLSDHINEVIDSMTSKIKNANEVSINLSVDFNSEPSHFDQIYSENDLKESVESFKNQKNLKEEENATKKLHEDKICERRSLQENHIIRKRKRNKKDKAPRDLSVENDGGDIKKFKMIENEIGNKDNTKKKKKLTSQYLSNGLVTVNFDNSDIKALQKLPKKTKEDTEIIKEEQEVRISKKKRTKRRKQAKNEIRLDINNKEEDEPSPLRKKMKTVAKTNRNKSELNSAGVIEEAVLNNKNKQLVLVASDLLENNGWDVKNTIIKPSLNPSRIKKLENKAITCSTSDGTKKFHSKDFKNLTLFDPFRIRRVDTKHMLKKKVLQF